MPSVRPPQGLEDSDYETIEAAVIETARGRWFLYEHARRTRESETAKLLDAIGQIETLVRDRAPPAPAFEAAKFGDVLGVLEERLLDLAWMMRSRGVESALCDVVDQEAARIGRALTGEIDTSRHIEPPALEELPRPEPAQIEFTPPVERTTSSIAAPPMVAPPEPMPEPLAEAPPEFDPGPPQLRPEALAFLNRMSPRERQRFFA